MREHRDFLTQVRTDEQNALQTFDFGDGQAQPRVGRLLLLSAEIKLAQAMIDVVAAKPARNARKQKKLLGSGRRSTEKSGRCTAMRRISSSVL